MNPPNQSQNMNMNINDQMDRAKDTIRNTGEAIAQTVTSVTGNLKQTTDDLFDSFRNNRYVSGTADFLESNSAIAKIAFLFLILILFTFALRVGTSILQRIYSPSPDPFLIKGMKRGNQPTTILQNTKFDDSITLLRSKNEDGGIEFTWNTWLFLETVTPDYQHIFHKGDVINTTIEDAIDNMINNGPGLYVRKSHDQAELRILMSTFDNNKGGNITIPNIPIQKWLNITIRVKHKYLDVYINNNIVHRHIFEGAPPKQNYGNVYVSNQGGFSGLISNLRYFNRSITGIEVANIVKDGPNLQSAGDDALATMPPYLSMRWYLPNYENRD
jgi:hypothetical protein